MYEIISENVDRISIGGTMLSTCVGTVYTNCCSQYTTHFLLIKILSSFKNK